jgi:hypothetical protein
VWSQRVAPIRSRGLALLFVLLETKRLAAPALEASLRAMHGPRRRDPQSERMPSRCHPPERKHARVGKRASLLLATATPSPYLHRRHDLGALEVRSPFHRPKPSSTEGATEAQGPRRVHDKTTGPPLQPAAPYDPSLSPKHRTTGAPTSNMKPTVMSCPSIGWTTRAVALRVAS